jgi:hypothetical protein
MAASPRSKHPFWKTKSVLPDLTKDPDRDAASEAEVNQATRISLRSSMSHR